MLTILIGVYVLAALLLAVYGFNSWVLTYLFYRNKDKLPEIFPAELDDSDLPAVTVQLPVYNEALVVERLINAVVQLDYPVQSLQIQVLDDSTDETTEIAAQCVAGCRTNGVDIQLIHRTHRVGYKAGALKEGLELASGQLIAIFDADFVPEPDFLRKTVPYFVAAPKLGFLQTRWGHLNRGGSWLTEAQALAIDGHFVVEQTARSRSGLLMNFNGTAGIWRRSCIEAAGGWQADTICEDFDLSYRAQLAGWQRLYLPDVVVRAEIPPQLAAFKRQQGRWAKGSIQCLKKLGGSVLRAPLSWPVKLQAIIHLSNYLAHPLLVILALITPILIMTNGTANIRFPLIYLSLASLGPPLLFAVAQMWLSPGGWLRNYKKMPLLILLGGGIALSGAKAVVEALLGVGSIFRRTPKFNVTAGPQQWQSSSYRLPLERLVLGELLLAGYALLGAVVAAVNGNLFAVPFILLYAFSFGYVGLLGVWEVRQDVKDWLWQPYNRQVRSKPAEQQTVRSQ